MGQYFPNRRGDKVALCVAVFTIAAALTVAVVHEAKTSDSFPDCPHGSWHYGGDEVDDSGGIWTGKDWEGLIEEAPPGSQGNVVSGCLAEPEILGRKGKSNGHESDSPKSSQDEPGQFSPQTDSTYEPNPESLTDNEPELPTDPEPELPTDPEPELPTDDQPAEEPPADDPPVNDPPVNDPPVNDPPAEEPEELEPEPEPEFIDQEHVHAARDHRRAEKLVTALAVAVAARQLWLILVDDDDEDERENGKSRFNRFHAVPHADNRGYGAHVGYDLTSNQSLGFTVTTGEVGTDVMLRWQLEF